MLHTVRLSAFSPTEGHSTRIRPVHQTMRLVQPAGRTAHPRTTCRDRRRLCSPLTESHLKGRYGAMAHGAASDANSPRRLSLLIVLFCRLHIHVRCTKNTIDPLRACNMRDSGLDDPFDTETSVTLGHPPLASQGGVARSEGRANGCPSCPPPPSISPLRTPNRSVCLFVPAS